jgi:RHS repeat-associated protein
MVKISAGGSTVASYAYDGKNRRIIHLGYSAGVLTETRHFYFTNVWQDVEQRVGTSTSADQQHVWGFRHIDELVCRDRTGERLYVCQEANFNTTALVDTSGSVQERFRYDPYGTFAVLTAAWSGSSDSKNWMYLYQGVMYDSFTSLHRLRNRQFNPAVGQWGRRDRAGYGDGLNLYEMEGGNPCDTVDPLGMQGGTIVVDDPSGGGYTIISPYAPHPYEHHTAPTVAPGYWKNERPLTPGERKTLLIYVCVAKAAMAGFGNNFIERQITALINGTLPSGVDIADPQDLKGPLGETHWQTITLGSQIFNDPILGPSTLFHEYDHWQSTMVGNAFFNLMELLGLDSASDPANTGNALTSRLMAIDRVRMNLSCPTRCGDPPRVVPQTALDVMYCKCGDKSRCKHC